MEELIEVLCFVVWKGQLAWSLLVVTSLFSPLLLLSLYLFTCCGFIISRE